MNNLLTEATAIRPRAKGGELPITPEKFGPLRPSREWVDDGDALRNRLQEDGYLFLPGALNRETVGAARQLMVERLAQDGFLDGNYPASEAVAAKEKSAYFMPDLSENNPPMTEVLYGDGPLMGIFARLFAEPVRHFDFTWIRAVTPGGSTAPHCDVVYMGRGTHELLTAWVPFGDIPLSIGGLILLEGSHLKHDQTGGYIAQDVDTFCENGPNRDRILGGKMGWEHWDGSYTDWDGSISHDAIALQNSLGGRWLTANYQMGDVLIFTMRTVHASLENRSDRVRLSSDTRYQPASLPVDERWVGERPIAHGLAGKRGKIC